MSAVAERVVDSDALIRDLRHMDARWLWSPVYKGLEVRFGRGRAFWFGWTHREWKKRGW